MNRSKLNNRYIVLFRISEQIQRARDQVTLRTTGIRRHWIDKPAQWYFHLRWYDKDLPSKTRLKWSMKQPRNRSLKNKSSYENCDGRIESSEIARLVTRKTGYAFSVFYSAFSFIFGVLIFYSNKVNCNTMAQFPVIHYNTADKDDTLHLNPGMTPEYYDNTVNINGHVTGIPNNNPLANSKVVIIKANNNIRIDSTYTDTSGFYNKKFIVSLTGEKENETAKDIIYPNPYSEQTNIETYIKETGNYKIMVRGADGKNLYTSSIALEQGENTITLNGGQTGIELITLTGENFQKTYKAIKISNDNSPINLDIKNSEPFAPKKLKSTLDDIILLVGEDIIMEFSKDGYNTENKSLTVAANNIVDAQLQQTPYTFTTTLKPFLETGEPVTVLNPNFTVTVNWSDGTTQTYPVNNGQININKDIYKNADGTLGTAWISNDTTGVDGVLNWSIIRQIKQKTNRPNVAQNETSAGVLIPDYKTSISLDSLDGKTLHYYTIRKRAETQPGVYEALNSGFSIGLYGSSGGLGTSMFIDLKPYGVADSLDLVRFSFNLDNGVANTPAEQTRLDERFQQAINVNYLQNGDTLLPPHRVYTISSFSDPKWQALTARGYENVVYTTYYNSTPENGRLWASTYTYNGYLRSQCSLAKYNIYDNNAIIFTEDFSAVNFEEEGAGGMVQYVWNGPTNQPAEYAYSIAAIPKLLNLGTGQNDKDIKTFTEKNNCLFSKKIEFLNNISSTK